MFSPRLVYAMMKVAVCILHHYFIIHHNFIIGETSFFFSVYSFVLRGIERMSLMVCVCVWKMDEEESERKEEEEGGVWNVERYDCRFLFHFGSSWYIVCTNSSLSILLSPQLTSQTIISSFSYCCVRPWMRSSRISSSVHHVSVILYWGVRRFVGIQLPAPVWLLFVLI